jgi:hypothetical protein
MGAQQAGEQISSVAEGLAISGRLAGGSGSGNCGRDFIKMVYGELGRREGVARRSAPCSSKSKSQSKSKSNIETNASYRTME